MPKSKKYEVRKIDDVCESYCLMGIKGRWNLLRKKVAQLGDDECVIVPKAEISHYKSFSTSVLRSALNFPFGINIYKLKNGDLAVSRKLKDKGNA